MLPVRQSQIALSIPVHKSVFNLVIYCNMRYPACISVLLAIAIQLLLLMPLASAGPAMCSGQPNFPKHQSSPRKMNRMPTKCLSDLTATSLPPTTANSSGQTLNIIGIVLGTLFGLVFIILHVVGAFLCYRWKCKDKQATSAEGELDASHTISNSPETINMNNYCGTGPSTSDYNSKKVVLSDDDAHDYEEPYFEPATKEEELVAQIKKLGVTEISRESKSLRLFNVLGSGAFGTVHRGIWLHSGSSSGQQLVEEEVAVKSMDGMASEEERVKFLQEAAIMGQFNHPNIITILGIIPNTPMMILIELMKTGDLRNHILDIREKNVNNPVPHELPPTLLSYSRQIASGMVYLSIKEFVHRDLAARNILISDNGTCKIADFGMSRDLQDATYYKSHGGKIPVKWTSPEALHYHKYSTASDVWSYGCVLYEIWSLGFKPFHDDTNAAAIKKVDTGFRLPSPPGCPRAVYDIMIKCWNPNAALRPSFFDMTVLLQKPDFMLLHWSQEENKCVVEARTLGMPLEAGHHLHMDLQKTYLVETEEVTSWQQDKPTQQFLEGNLEVDKNFTENDDDGYLTPIVTIGNMK